MSKLYVVGDRLEWSIDDDRSRLVATAHRLHPAHAADVIAVVENGRISELGSHNQLVEADGAYAALWRSWHG